MFPKRSILTKTQWMGISALIMALVMILNPVLCLAEEGSSDGEIVIFSSDGTESVVGGSSSGSDKSTSVTDTGTISGSTQGRASDIITADEIWSLVDFDELRALIDEDEIRSRIDVVALLDSIDRDALRAEIDGQELLGELSEDELKDEFVKRKLEGEFFILDTETGEGRVVSEEEYNNILNAKTAEDLPEDEVMKDGDKESEQTEVIDDSSLADIIEEGTRVLEDGREISSFKVRIPDLDVEKHPTDVINVQLPVLDEDGPFNYLVDPLKLLSATDAARYGNGRVEEDASVIFKNSEGEYDYSHRSDKLKVVNKGNTPVKIIISAFIKGGESILLVGDESDLNGDLPCLYMALEDDTGTVLPVSNSGEVVMEKVLKAAPDDTYQYSLNEETGEYEHTLAENAENTSFDEFSFGVVAACNTEANWSGVDSLPVINVSWQVEPILTDWDYINAGLMDKEKERLLADSEQFEAFKLVKTGELVEEKLLELTQVKLDELKEAEFEALVEEELANLADDKLEEIIEEKGLQDRFVVEEHETKSSDNTKSEKNDTPSSEEEKSEDSETEKKGVLGARRDFEIGEEVEEQDAVTFSDDSLNDVDDSSYDSQENSDEVIFIDESASQKPDSSVIFFDSYGN